MNPLRVIFGSFGIMVAIILASSFALSYANLKETALEAGIEPILSPLWPLTLDCFLVLASLFILRANLMKESPAPGWAVLLVFTGVSTAFNVIHSPDNLLARASHAIPPIALCVSLELLMMILKSDLSVIAEPEKKPETPKRNLRTPKNETDNLIEAYFLDHPEASINRARKDLGISWKTVNDYRNKNQGTH